MTSHIYAFLSVTSRQSFDSFLYYLPTVCSNEAVTFNQKLKLSENDYYLLTLMQTEIVVHKTLAELHSKTALQQIPLNGRSN